MPRKPKMQTSNDLIRENYGWPMTAGQVSKLTGVTTRALQHYDEKGLLCPRRSGEGVANNRKLYSPEDVDRLKQIVVLGSYGFELKDMPPILDGERSLTDALAERIEELRAQERYLQHLILFARYAEIVGDDLFETLASAPPKWMRSPSSCEARRPMPIKPSGGNLWTMRAWSNYGTSWARSSSIFWEAMTRIPSPI